MAFYSPDQAMDQILADRLRGLEQAGRPGLREQLSITWVRFEGSQVGVAADLPAGQYWQHRATGACWGGDRLRYPASVVKLVYLVAAEAWLQQGWLADGPELRRALAAMVQHSSNDATSLVVDLLTGTCSGPELAAGAWQEWQRQRQLVNTWLQELHWPELEGVNACQKTWGDGPYGRERLFYGEQLDNRNRLSTDAVARLLLGVISSALVSPPAAARMRDLLERSLEAGGRSADPENQVDGFLGEGLPQGARLWSKAGWMSQARHDAAYIELEGGPATLLVAFSEGGRCAGDAALLPALARELCGV